MRIYLAGPLFTTAERDFNTSLRDRLERLGHAVWLPQEHDSPGLTARQVFNADVAAIDEADVVVANMDGPDPDSGTSWECGYAHGRGKPVIMFRTDFRLGEMRDRAPFNTMLAESASRPPLMLAFRDADEIADALDGELRALGTAGQDGGCSRT